MFLNFLKNLKYIKNWKFVTIYQIFKIIEKWKNDYFFKFFVNFHTKNLWIKNKYIGAKNKKNQDTTLEIFIQQ